MRHRRQVLGGDGIGIVLVDVAFDVKDGIVRAGRRTGNPLRVAVGDNHVEYVGQGATRVKIRHGRRTLEVVHDLDHENDEFLRGVSGQLAHAAELTGDSGVGIENLIEEIKKKLPNGPEYFPKDMISDQPDTFLVAEIIREKIFINTKREIPYSSAVTVTSMSDNPEKGLLSIHASIHVETESQKGIIVGKGGAMIKRIGEAARNELERLLGIHIFLELQAKVDKNWTKDTKALKKLGY